MGGRHYPPVEDRLWANVDRHGPVPTHAAELGSCWIWTGPINETGYGRLWVRGRRVRVHRLAYELVIGEVPEGLELDHLCRNRACCNPAHLEAVTHAGNMARGRYPKRDLTHCQHGHEFTPENTYVRDNMRTCRICKNARQRARRAQLKAA